MMDSSFASTYGVDLLFERLPQLSKGKLLDSLRRRCGGVVALDGKADSDSLVFSHVDHPITYDKGVIPAQTFMAAADRPPDAAKLEAAVQQSWDWPEARTVLQRCRQSLIVTDFMSSGLPRQSRLDLFHRVVLAVLDVVSPVALHWVRSQRLVNVAAYQISKAPSRADVVYPAINVRLFNIKDRAPSETVMDTIGLAALGVPDLQCHFVQLDPTEMARVLYNSACYIYENGDVINDGETLQGIGPNDRWHCRHENSLVGPDRVVLDVNPGPNHAAGTRR